LNDYLKISKDTDLQGDWGRAVEGENSSMIYLMHCKNFVNATMYPHPAQQLKKVKLKNLKKKNSTIKKN
jgi:hypothetical protein